MDVRGERECKDCGARWSYYETGSVTCPECGSVRSVGTDDERKRHTDLGADLDLGDARTHAANDRLREAADAAESAAREYVRRRGFVSGGDLRDLDDTYLAATELRHAASELGRALDVSEDAEYYFIGLLRGAEDGERPARRDVPESYVAVRGLGYATAVRAYRREVREWYDAGDVDRPHARSLLERLGDHVKRVRALDGDVPLDDSERLVEAARDAAAYLRSGDENVYERARTRLENLE